MPDVRKAVGWNSPFYGIEREGWFVSYHVLTRNVRVTFLNHALLRPVPLGSGKDEDSRWIDVYEDMLDEEKMATGSASHEHCPAGAASIPSNVNTPGAVGPHPKIKPITEITRITVQTDDQSPFSIGLAMPLPFAGIDLIAYHQKTVAPQEIGACTTFPSGFTI